MKNVKFGFQFGLGFYLAKVLWNLPIAVQNPRVKREWNRLMKVIQDTNQDKTREEQTEPPPIRNTSAFPQCKNKIGFDIE